MIQPHELRIGNWVSANRMDHFVPYQIRPEDFVNGNMEWMLPIELTWRILSDSAFRMVHQNPRIESIYLYTGGHAYHSFELKLDREDRIWFYYGSNEVLVKTVHQLQNIFFSVTGEDLEINVNPV